MPCRIEQSRPSLQRPLLASRAFPLKPLREAVPEQLASTMVAPAQLVSIMAVRA
jgi:hypothetical protein